jgi:hypothetical protein
LRRAGDPVTASAPPSPNLRETGLAGRVFTMEIDPASARKTTLSTEWLPLSDRLQAPARPKREATKGWLPHPADRTRMPD